MATRENSPAGQTVEQDLVITRILRAPRELVFSAWSEPERAMRWWGPKGFTMPYCRIDFRPGGIYHNCMRSPEGRDYWSIGVYREIVEPERIVCTDSFSDEQGNRVPATYYGMSEDLPMEMLVTVTFEEQDDTTILTLRHAGIPVGKERDGATEGWSQSFDKLAEYLLAENLADEEEE
jgi:uncharacterized protein YndB with AHSA1/START domain